MRPSERPEGRIIALTGATGFLGGHVLDALVASGARVQCLVRDPAAAAALARRGAVPVIGDLLESAAPAGAGGMAGPERNAGAASNTLARLVDGAHVVIHSAGLTKARSRDEFARGNVAGTARLAVAARAAGAQRFIHISSMAAMQPALSDYAASKLASEHACARALSGEAALVILRPPAIFGPGDREMAPLWAMARHGFLPAPRFPKRSGRARLAIVFVADVVSAIVAAMSGPTGTFSLNDGRPTGYEWPEFAAILARVHGRPVRLVRIPRGLLAAAGHIAGGLARLQNRAQVFGAGKVREMLHPDWTSPADDLARIGVWSPAWDFERALRVTLQSTANPRG